MRTRTSPPRRPRRASRRSCAPWSAGRRDRSPPLDVGVVDLLEDVADPEAVSPPGVVAAEGRHVGDPPPVVTRASLLVVGPDQLATRDVLREVDGLQERTAAL